MVMLALSEDTFWKAGMCIGAQVQVWASELEVDESTVVFFFYVTRMNNSFPRQVNESPLQTLEEVRRGVRHPGTRATPILTNVASFQASFARICALTNLTGSSVTAFLGSRWDKTSARARRWMFPVCTQLRWADRENFGALAEGVWKKNVYLNACTKNPTQSGKKSKLCRYLYEKS